MDALEGTVQHIVPCSLLFLARKSRVFKRMFSTGFREGAGAKTARIVLSVSGDLSMPCVVLPEALDTRPACDRAALLHFEDSRKPYQ